MLSEVPLHSVNEPAIVGVSGLEQMILHPDGTHLYAPSRDVIRIHATADGALMGTKFTGIQHPGAIAIAGGLR